MLIAKIYPQTSLLSISTSYVLSTYKFSSFLVKSMKNMYKLSVQNYMKTYASDQITRTHGRMRVDENAKLYS
jgi:hypothetical protein